MLGMVLNKRKLLADRELLGRWGEKRCHGFLKRKGLKTLTRNFSCKTGEIDLIRADETFNPVESSITAPKKARLVRTARYFLTTHKIDDRPFRFDVVTIVLGQKGPPQIRHYENAFVP